MEWAGIFILILFVGVVAVIGGIVYAIAARGRQKQLSTKGGSLDAGREAAPQDGERPAHVAVETEQHARFIGSG